MLITRFKRALAVTATASIVLAAMTLASSVDESVVDSVAPTTSVTISAGGSGNITINLSVTGNQVGTATFDVYRDWSLSGGNFSGSNAQTFTVNARAAQDPATTFSTTGTISVDSGQGAGTFTLHAGAFNIANSNSTGAKLAAGSSSSYAVTVPTAVDPCLSVPAPAAPVISPDPTTDYDGNAPWFITAPTVTATSATAGATIDYATQANGGLKSAYSSTAPTLVDGTTVVYARATSATCSKVSESSATFYVDTQAPTINDTGFVSGTAGSHGWYTSAVSNGFSASDNQYGSGLGSFSTPWNVSSGTDEGSAVLINSGPVTDLAGNTNNGIDSAAYMIDLGAPTVAYTSASPLPNAAGWNNTDVVATFTATDNVSGFSAAGDPTTTGTSTTTGEGMSVTVGSPAFTDWAGNTAAAGAATSDPFMIDETAPSTSVTGVSDGATYTLGSVPAAGCSTVETLSGVKSASVLSTSGGPVGSVTASCGAAVDNADNVGNAPSVSYSVVYNWHGFFSPVDNLPVLNVAKAGSAIPVKFNLSGNQGLAIMAAGFPASRQITCDSTDTQDAIESTITAGGSSLSYDATADQYIYVWKTDKAWAGTCRQLTVKLIDGTSHYANFKLTK